MISDRMMEELSQLDRSEKLRVIQLLMNQISRQENILSETEYEVWSPFDAPVAAGILMDMLERDRNTHG